MFNPVVFVSLGPGEADLITIKGLKHLQSAQLVYCPATTLPNNKVTSRGAAILSELGIERSKIVLFQVPMSKDRELALQAYREITDRIIQKQQEGLRIAVTVEGDAGFYSSVHYIMDELRERHIPVSQIAGIPAFIACEATAGMHLVKQEEQLQVIPGVIAFEDLLKEIREGKVLVIMKTSQCETVIKQAMTELPDRTFHYFENVGVKEKEFYTTNHRQILERAFPYFSLLIIRP